MSSANMRARIPRSRSSPTSLSPHIGCGLRTACLRRPVCTVTCGICDIRRCPAEADAADFRSPRLRTIPRLRSNSIWALPGQYTVRLTVDGKSYTQPLTLKMDPRVKTTAYGLQLQFRLSKELYDDIVAAHEALAEIRAMHSQDPRLAELAGAGGGGGRGGRGAVAAGPDSLNSVVGALGALMQALQSADVTPTTQEVAAVANRREALAKLIGQWIVLKAELGGKKPQ